MNCSTPAAAGTHSDASFIQKIAESLKSYEADACLRVPKTDVDYMDAMCAIAKCGSKSEVTTLLYAHVNKRKQPKNPTARYHLSAALEAYAAHVQTSRIVSSAPGAGRQKAELVQKCMYRAESHLLDGYKRDPNHVLAHAFFRENPGAAQCAQSNVASRMTLASLGQARLPPSVYRVPATDATPFAGKMFVAPIPMQQQPPASPFGQLPPLALHPPLVGARSLGPKTPTQPSMTGLLCEQSFSAPLPTQQPMTTLLLESPQAAASPALPCLSQGLLPCAPVVLPTGSAQQKTEPKLVRMLPPRPGAKTGARSKAKKRPAGEMLPPPERCTPPKQSPPPRQPVAANALSPAFRPDLKSPSPHAGTSGDSDLMGFLESLASETFLDDALDPAIASVAQTHAKQHADWSTSGRGADAAPKQFQEPSGNSLLNG